MVAARRLARWEFGRDHPPVYRALAQVLAALAWPPAVLMHLWEIRWYRGPKAVPIQRMPGALWAALRHNVLPGEYYAYALWKPDRKLNIDNYLYAKEGPRLFRLLNTPVQPNPIDDKLAFYEICRSHALPSPEILAAFTPNGKLLEFESGRPPKRDLFVKSRTGLGSVGAERFRWKGVAFKNDRGCQVAFEDISAYLLTRALVENRTLLVQPALSNHTELHISANASLATARLVTGLLPDGNVVPVFGSFSYFAQVDRVPACYARVALIDIASGRLVSEPREFSDTEHHHLDDSSDDARMLPNWRDVLHHVKVAHQACSNFVFIGWDVAFTEHGPMLLEGNLNWCADEYQRLRGEPLGNTKFADILAARLRDLQKRIE